MQGYLLPFVGEPVCHKTLAPPHPFCQALQRCPGFLRQDRFRHSLGKGFQQFPGLRRTEVLQNLDGTNHLQRLGRERARLLQKGLDAPTVGD